MSDKHMTINGIGYTRDDAIPAPTFVDADELVIKVGDAVRVRLSSLDAHNMDEDNRHGTIRQIDHQAIGIEFPHRLCNGNRLNDALGVLPGHGRYFSSSEVRRD